MFRQLVQLLLLITVEAIQVTNGTACVFPSYMITGKNTWQNSLVFEGKNNVRYVREIWAFLENRKSARVQVFDQVLASSDDEGIFFDTSRPSSGEYEMQCHVNVGNDEEKVIIRKIKNGKITYQCFVFSKRSEYVITFDKSPESSELEGVCDDDELFYSPSPLIYFETVADNKHQNMEKLLEGKSYIVCPWKGGYKVNTIMARRGRSTCRSMPGFSRIENECERGDGLTLFWPKVNGNECDLEPRRMFCFASWKNAGYSFMLVATKTGFTRATYHCMRYKGLGEVPEDNVMYLFNNSICHVADDLETQLHDPLQSYIKYEILAQDTSGIGLCSDKSTDCSLASLADFCTRPEKVICAEGCKLCPTPRPWPSVSIDKQFTGTFIRNSLNRGKEEVVISDKGIMIPQMGYYEVLAENACKFKFSEEYGSFEMVTTYLALQRGSAGCMPQMTLVAIKEITSSVYLYKISQGVHIVSPLAYPSNALEKAENWNFTDGCGLLFFHSDGFKPLNNLYHHSVDAWDVLIRKQPMPNKIKCAQLLKPQVQLKFSGKGNCQGSITPREENTSFDFTLDMCSETSANTSIANFVGETSTLKCLAVLHGQTESEGNLILTKIIPGGANVVELDHVCWWLSGEEKVGYLVPVGNCHPALISDVRLRGLKPVATLFGHSERISGSIWALVVLIALYYLF